MTDGIAQETRSGRRAVAAPPEHVSLPEAAWEGEHNRELLDRVVTGLFHAGLSLQAAASLPADAARERIDEVLQRLDDTIREIRDHVLRSRPPGSVR